MQPKRLPSGACGAFVQALEDQYLEVRMAAIDAMGELATHCWVWRSIANKICLLDCFDLGCAHAVVPHGVWLVQCFCMQRRGRHVIAVVPFSQVFGSRALDFLVDMLNDEIDEVRMNAMLCLRKVREPPHQRGGTNASVRNLPVWPGKATPPSEQDVYV
jgi:hypothetical protein